MRAGLIDTVARIVDGARRERRSVLRGPECLEIAGALGLGIPECCRVASADDVESATACLGFPGDRLVVKVVSDEIPHKTELGGVRVVPKRLEAVREAVASIARSCAGFDVVEFTIHRFVEHDTGPLGELLLGLRITADFGPIVTLGPGGVWTEWFAVHAGPGLRPAILSPALGKEVLRQTLDENLFAASLTARFREAAPRIPRHALENVLEPWLGLAAAAPEIGLVEFEVNPVGWTDDGPFVLDALGSIDSPQGSRDDRPIAKLPHLLRPRHAAVIGVSRSLNPGRIILRNMLRAGFPRERLTVVKPDCSEIDGCACVPELAALPRRVDLIVLAVDAAQVPGALQQIVDERLAESVILIPGGLGERAGTESRSAELRGILQAARATDWRGPLVNGGNCLGIRSRPGACDTLFIPESKLPRSEEEPAPIALIAQSGAFAVSRMSKLPGLDPRYVITVGNQIDLTVGDYLTHLKDDPELDLFACYAEGFRRLDGSRFLAAAAELGERGKSVILYRAGRTEAGARASASHTASIAGDYAVTRELCRAAGVVVADDLQDFEDLVRLFHALRGKRVGGWRLGAISNAGFECVAIADHAGRFELPPPTDSTRAALEELLGTLSLDSIVDVRNPFDVTPIADDATFAEATHVLLQDTGFDVALVGCVPLTGALQTLSPTAAPDGVTDRLVRRIRACDKAVVAVVDAGPLYDAMAGRLEAGGVPTFRSAERALRLFERFCAHRLQRIT